MSIAHCIKRKMLVQFVWIEYPVYFTLTAFKHWNVGPFVYGSWIGKSNEGNKELFAICVPSYPKGVNKL